MPNKSITLTPLENPPTIRFNKTPLEFKQAEHRRNSMEKHFTLSIEESNQSIVNIKVIDGLKRSFNVQICIGRTSKIYQCNCQEFVNDRCNYCDHVAVVVNLWENLYHYENPGASMFKRELIQAVRTASRFLSNQLKWFNSFEQKTQLEISRVKNPVVVLSEVASLRKPVSLGETRPDKPNLKSSGLLDGIILYDYQEDVFAKMLVAEKAICSMAVGSGKTLTTIGCLGWVRKNEITDPKVLIVCPKSLKLQWKTEIEKTLHVQVETIDSSKQLGSATAKILITTYQLFSREDQKFVDYNFDFVVFDEIQFIRNNETKVWKSAKKLTPKYFFGLSGTVIENRLDDLYSIMDVVSPGLLGPKWWFSARFQNLIGMSRTQMLFDGVRDEAELKKLIAPFVFSYNEVILPCSITYKDIAVDMSFSQRSSHENYYDQAKILQAKAMSTKLTFGEQAILQSMLLKARQSCNSETLISKMPSQLSPKLKKLMEIVEEYKKQDKKIVVFSQWTELLDLISDELKKAKIGFVKFTGRETEKQRFKAIKQFQQDKNTFILLASDSGGVGVDGLQFASSTIIHVEPPWNPAKIDQRNGRLFRLGQTKQVTAICLYAHSSIEENMLSTLNKKRNIRETVLVS